MLASASAHLEQSKAARKYPLTSSKEAGKRLVELYKQWFDVVPVETPEQLEASFRLRYQVYCLETGFENKDEFPDGMERDEYDERSVASLLVHKPTGKIAGTVRLILPDPDAADAPALPATRVSPDLQTLIPDSLPPASTAEISRFSISKDFRKRREDGVLPALYKPSGEPGDQRVIPHITLGLMQAIVKMSIDNDITHLCIMVEPALDRLVRRLGIHFTPIGDLVDYHGRRRAHYCDNNELASDIYGRSPEIWDVLTDGGKLWPGPC